MAELNPELAQKIESMINESMNMFSLEAPEPSQKILIEAWNMLPEDRHNYTEGYYLSQYLAHAYYRTNNLAKAQEWMPAFFLCDHTQRNTGESEFLAGQIAVATNDLDKAKKYFTLSNRKCEGRYFSGENKKYKVYIDKTEIRPTKYKDLVKTAKKEMEAKNYGYALSLLYDCLNQQLMDPTVYLMKGKCHVELNESDHAADSLTRAYMLEGDKIFKKEDPKYFEFLKTRIDINKK